MDESGSLYTDILAELECPICTDYMAPPIRQCETGHSLCDTCMKKLSLCPLCQGKFTNANNISLQALAYKVPYPCMHVYLGCDAKLKLEQRENHEKNCSFKGFSCATENCTWTGKLQDIKHHWTSKGKPVRSSINPSETCMNIDSYFVNLAEAYNQLFWLKRKLENGRIYWAVQLIGRVDEASHYCYEIDIYESEISERRITLRDYCKSIEIDDSELFSKDVCLTTVSTDCLKHFINKNQSLFYNIRIHETEKYLTNDK